VEQQKPLPVVYREVKRWACWSTSKSGAWRMAFAGWWMPFQILCVLRGLCG